MSLLLDSGKAGVLTSIVHPGAYICRLVAYGTIELEGIRGFTLGQIAVQLSDQPARQGYYPEAESKKLGTEKRTKHSSESPKRDDFSSDCLLAGSNS